LATKFLKAPHDLEYEKTFMPFCLLSKKRYVGMLYEEDPDKCYRKSMGIVLKRRDNAPIVKDVYGGIIDILMKKQNIQEAVEFTKQCLRDMVQEKYSLEKLVITKSLRGFYKVPKQIAHKVLADRIAKRDPGNKPAPGDRIPFVYIQKKKWKLQGDKVEHPEYIRKHRLKPDYSHYITNQIMKPVLQLFALVMEEMPEFSKFKKEYEKKVYQMEKTLPEDKYIDKRQKLREDIVKKLVFDDSLRISDNSKKGNRAITSFFQPRSRAL
jgi:DNA polymerase elongation subunit (family B)